MSQTSRIFWNYSSGLPLCLAMKNNLRLRTNATSHKMKIRLALRFSECRRSDSKSPQKLPYAEIDFLPSLGLKSIDYVKCFPCLETRLDTRASQEATRNAGTGTHSSFCSIALRKSFLAGSFVTQNQSKAHADNLELTVC